MPTLTDGYGRSVTITPDQDGSDVYAVDGLTLSFAAGTDQAHALSALSGMLTAAILPAEMPPVPIPNISDRQFFEQLAVMGKITEDEALAYVGPGTLPEAIVTGLSQLPAEQQFTAKMLLIGARSFERANPLAAQLSAIFGMAPTDLDALWLAAALL